MALHETGFGYLNPTDEQKDKMLEARNAAADYAAVIQAVMPDGPDRTYALRQLRTVAMWVNVGITRQPDGAPRE